MTTADASHTPDSPDSPDAREPYVARGPDDILGLVPLVLDFEPENSLVMLTLGGRSSFHARIDLPPPGDDDALEELVRVLHAPAVQHAVQAVVLVAYTSRRPAARRVVTRLERRLELSGIRVVDALRAHDGRWWPVHAPLSRVPDHGVPYDSRAHRFRTRAVVEGHVTLGSREELAATLHTDPALVALLTTLRQDRTAPTAEDVEEVVSRIRLEGAVLEPADLLVLALAAGEPDLRDLPWLAMDRAGARRHVEAWTQVVRAAPRDLLADAAALLAFAAWLSGQGALSWCAVDVAVAQRPDHSVARMVSELLAGAVSPSTWADLAG